MHVDDRSMKRDRPKKTWMEVVRIDLTKCNILEDLAQDRSECKNRIHAADPSTIRIRALGTMMECFGDDDDSIIIPKALVPTML